MKTSIRKIPAVFLLVVLCLTAFPVSAFAADAVNVAIPVSVELSGETPSPEETYTVVLQAVDDAPMPAENTLEITGEGTAAFPAITYSTPGIYCYTIAQQRGSHVRGNYDATTYYVRVSVINDGNGGLGAVVAAHTDAQMESEKQDIIFANAYDKVKDTPSVADGIKPHKTISPQKTSTKSKTGSVKTGDDSELTLWISLLAASGIGLLLAAAKRKQSKHV